MFRGKRSKKKGKVVGIADSGDGASLEDVLPDFVHPEKSASAFLADSVDNGSPLPDKSTSQSKKSRSQENLLTVDSHAFGMPVIPEPEREANRAVASKDKIEITQSPLHDGAVAVKHALQHLKTHHSDTMAVVALAAHSLNKGANSDSSDDGDDDGDDSDEDEEDDANGPVVHRRIIHRRDSAVQFAIETLTDGQIQLARDAFDVVDIDGSNSLTHDELCLIVTLLGLANSKETMNEDVKVLMEALDGDGNGEIVFDEFLSAIKAGYIELFPREVDPDSLDEFGMTISNDSEGGDKPRVAPAPTFSISYLLQVKAAFKVADPNGDGYIEKDELKAVKKTLRKSIPNRKFRQIWKRFDRQGKWPGAIEHIPGKVTWVEFLYQMADMPKSLKHYLDFSTVSSADSMLVQKQIDEAEHMEHLGELNLMERFGVKMMRRLSRAQVKEKRKSRVDMSVVDGHSKFSPRTSAFKFNEEEKKADLEAKERHENGEFSAPGDSATPWNQTRELGMISDEVVSQIESSMFRCILRVACVGAIASAICAAADVLAEYMYASKMVDGIAIPSLSGILIVKVPMLVFAAVFEVGWLYYDTLVECMTLATFVGLVLWPLDDIRSTVAVNLTRAALEMGQNTENVLFINALKEASELRVAIVALLYKAKMGLSKFLVKLAVKRVMTRCGVRETSSLAWAGFAAVPVGFLWNAVVCRKIVREARVRALGARIALSLADKLVLGKDSHNRVGTIRPVVRHQCLRAIGINIVKARGIHPNVEILLKRLNEHFHEMENDPDKHLYYATFEKNWHNLTKTQKKAATFLGYFPPKAEEGLSNSATGHKRWPRHDFDKSSMKKKGAASWPAWDSLSADQKEAAQELGIFKKFYPPGTNSEMPMCYQLKLDNEQYFYKMLDDSNFGPGQGFSADEKLLVFKVFLLSVMLDGVLRAREIPMLNNMVELLGYTHPEVKHFIELWVRDTVSSLRAGVPIRLEGSADHVFVHLDVISLLDMVQKSASEYDEKNAHKKKKHKWPGLPELEELHARNQKNAVCSCIEACLSIISC